MVKPPIIVDNRGDILIFETTQQAQDCLEPIDIRNHEYVAYDSDGRKLELAIIPPEPLKVRLRRLLFPVERTELRSRERDVACVDELRNKLIVYIDHLERTTKGNISADVLDMLEKAKNILMALEK